MILINKDKKKFVVDAMLGNVAKKLRLFGFDTKYFSTITDSDILLLLKNEDRILITKDLELSKKALKQHIMVVFLKGHSEYEQFLEIKKQLGLTFCINLNNTRCSLCNGDLSNISKLNIQNHIPAKVIEFTNDFWWCNSCNKVYWEGTHIINLQNFVKRINEQQ